MRQASLPLLLLALTPGSVAAQWGVGAEIGVARFGGSSRDTSGTVVGPYRPTTLALRIETGSGDVALAATVMYAKTGVAGEGKGLAVVQYDAASFWEVAPVVSLRVARFGAGAETRLEAGPAVDVWTVDGDNRTRLAGQAAAVLQWPVVGSFAGSVRVNGTISESMFDSSEVPSGVERRATRRFGVAIGLRYRL